MFEQYEQQRQKAIKDLIENAQAVSDDQGKMSTIQKLPGIVTTKVDGQTVLLPGYIPFIGKKYFHPHTKGRRILAYALSQNLRPNAEHTLKWAENWVKSDGLIALNRQNVSFESSGRSPLAMMHPFDTGHIPILCGLLRHLLKLGGRGSQSFFSIYDEIAATNLSKFSFRTASGRRTTDRLDSLRYCWEWFSLSELSILKPDYILCAGEAVYKVVREGLPTKSNIFPIKVAFPSLQVINRWYRKPGKPDTSYLLSEFSEEDLNRRVKQRKALREVIERDWYYFEQMYESMREQLREHGRKT